MKDFKKLGDKQKDIPDDIKKVVNDNWNELLETTATDGTQVVPNNELADKLEKWAIALAESGGKKWVLCVPVDFKNDPDMLMCEAARRLRSQSDLKSELSNLLALIHRDGGHHEQEVGTVQAIRDAEEVVKKLREGYRFLRAKITEE